MDSKKASSQPMPHMASGDFINTARPTRATNQEQPGSIENIDPTIAGLINNRSSTPLPIDKDHCKLTPETIPELSSTQDKDDSNAKQLVLQQELNESQLSSKDVQEILETDLSCAICQDIYINPLILNCSHSFCKFCLYRWLSKKTGCPQCRMTVSFQAENLALRNIINKMVLKSGLQYQTNRTQCINQRLKDEEALDKTGITKKFNKQAIPARPIHHWPSGSDISPRGAWPHHVHLSFFSTADFGSDENSGSGQAVDNQDDSDSDDEPGIDDHEDIDVEGSDFEDLDDSRDATFDIDQESIDNSDSDIQQEDADDDDVMDGMENSSSSSSDESDSEIQYEPDNYHNQVDIEDDDDDDDDGNVRYHAPYDEPDFDDSSISSDSDSNDLIESISSERNRGLESDDEEDCVQRPASSSINMDSPVGMLTDGGTDDDGTGDEHSLSSSDSEMETDRYSDESTIEYESDDESG